MIPVLFSEADFLAPLRIPNALDRRRGVEFEIRSHPVVLQAAEFVIVHIDGQIRGFSARKVPLGISPENGHAVVFEPNIL
jgi:hypothetical protein